jgi:hypothetical protein
LPYGTKIILEPATAAFGKPDKEHFEACLRKLQVTD